MYQILYQIIGSIIAITLTKFLQIRIAEIICQGLASNYLIIIICFLIRVPISIQSDELVKTSLLPENDLTYTQARVNSRIDSSPILVRPRPIEK